MKFLDLVLRHWMWLGGVISRYFFSTRGLCLYSVFCILKMIQPNVHQDIVKTELREMMVHSVHKVLAAQACRAMFRHPALA